jgi:hypothetical protein
VFRVRYSSTSCRTGRDSSTADVAKEDCKSPAKNISTALAFLRVNSALVGEGDHLRLNRCELNRFLQQNAKSPSAWTGETEPWITSSSRGVGAASNTKNRTCRTTKPRRKPNVCLANISGSTIGNGPINRSTTELRRPFIGSRLEKQANSDLPYFR